MLLQRKVLGDFETLFLLHHALVTGNEKAEINLKNNEHKEKIFVAFSRHNLTRGTQQHCKKRIARDFQHQKFSKSAKFDSQ